MTNWFVVGALGAGIGIVELIIAYIAYKASKQPVIANLKYFAYGMVVLAISHLFCKALMKATLHILAPWGVPLKAIGLTLVIYSMMLLIDEKKAKAIGAIAAVLATIFLIGSAYSLLTTKGRDWIFPTVHILFLALLPWYVAYLSYKVYKESGDKSALYVATAFIVYGLATVANMMMFGAGYSMAVSMAVSLPLRLLAEIIMLYAFVGT